MSSESVSARLEWQQRVIEEKVALDTKRIALLAFIQNDSRFKDLPAAEQARMKEQWEAMNWYGTVLGQRIAAFSGV